MHCLCARPLCVLIDDLANDARSLDLAVHRILQQTSANRLLLVVNQFEELFTLCRDEKERQAFVDNLLTAAVVDDDGPTIVILTALTSMPIALNMSNYAKHWPSGKSTLAP